MTAIKGRDENAKIGGDGLRGPDKQQADLRDVGGTYGDGRAQARVDAGKPVPDGAKLPTDDFNLPEGLKRQRMGPYDKDQGRAPAQPQPKE